MSTYTFLRFLKTTFRAYETRRQGPKEAQRGGRLDDRGHRRGSCFHSPCGNAPDGGAITWRTE